jgi:predicted GIY-YIG superfamily endonuclease
VSTVALAKADKNKNQMFYVYLIKSISHPEQKYIGQTDDLKNRLKQHNAGYSIHTAKYKPWELVNYFAFSSKDAALEFEQYLKTGSGYAFAKRHFWK